MPRANKVCSASGCPNIVVRDSKRTRCGDCERKAEQGRGSAHARGYGGPGHARFRAQVLARDPICTLCRRAPAAEADHYPLSRRELVRQHLNPNDPKHGRGLCHDCHSGETADHQPGGWHATQ